MTKDTYEERPKLYNQATIIIFSILLSTIFGGIIYSKNLSEIDDRKQIASVLVFCVIWNIVLFKLAHRYTDNFVLTFLLPNMMGGLVLSIFFWKHHFGDLDFKARNVWIPLAILLLIYGLFAGLRFLGN
jgi:hypothetical protein